jgi:glutamyl-tRNA synthetase
MLSGVDFIIRSDKHLSGTPKQKHIKEQLGYEEETAYAHLPLILNAEGRRDDGLSVKWLFEQGFIPDAIANYLILLGNDTPKEIFTLPEALEWFDLNKISKSPINFDIDKLRYINRKHLEKIDDKRLSMVFGFADEEIGRLSKLYLEEASTLNELEAKIKAIFSPKDFSGKWGEEMRILERCITQAPMIETFDTFQAHLMQESGLEGDHFDKPLQILLTGSEQGPELKDIYPHIKSYLLEVAS